MTRITVKFPYMDNHMYMFTDGQWRRVSCDCDETATVCNAKPTFQRGELSDATTRRITYNHYLSQINEAAYYDLPQEA